MEVSMGEKEKISDEMVEAKRVGWMDTVRQKFGKNELEGEGGSAIELDLTVRTFAVSLSQNTVLCRYPMSPTTGVTKLKDVDLYGVGEESMRKRIAAGGGVAKGGREDRRMAGRSLWGGF